MPNRIFIQPQPSQLPTLPIKQNKKNNILNGNYSTYFKSLINLITMHS